MLFINLDPDTSLSTDILTRGNREQELLQTAFQAVYPPLVKYDGKYIKVNNEMSIRSILKAH